MSDTPFNKCINNPLNSSTYTSRRFILVIPIPPDAKWKALKYMKCFYFPILVLRCIIIISTELEIFFRGREMIFQMRFQFYAAYDAIRFLSETTYFKTSNFKTKFRRTKVPKI